MKNILISAVTFVTLAISSLTNAQTVAPTSGGGDAKPKDSVGEQQPPPAVTTKTIPDSQGTAAWSAASSDKDFSGKRLKYPVQIIATVVDGAPGKNKVCIPADTPLRGLSRLTAAGILVRLRQPDTKDGTVKFDKKCKQELDYTLEEAYEHPLSIAKTDVESLPVDINGLSYGLLFVPFKYHVGGSKDFNGSGSVGPYAGYKTESSSWASSLEFVGFLGLSSISVEQNVDGKPIKNDLSALSYGVAVIGRIRGDFQVGLVLGADRVSNGSKYTDNGKPWIAVSIGYAFSR